jgi:heat-inducible transcriptional repressor
MAKLDDRKQKVLKAVVDDYTVTAVPVGSQALAARYFARWSAATIRNELAFLMETGHLEQPHTSSGRIPSDRGYRYFVDFLMEEEPVEAGVEAGLHRLFRKLPVDLEAILEGTAMALAHSMENVGVVTAPRTSEARLKYVDLVHLDGPRILALVVLEGNIVRQQLMDLESEIKQERLSELSGRLNQMVKGSTQVELRGHLEGGTFKGWEKIAAEGIADFMAVFDAQSATVVVHDGVRNLVRQPEFLETEKLVPVLELLEQSRELARVLESIDAEDEVEFVIGDENPDTHLRGCSLVLTSYTALGFRGTLGTIGPTRMRYPQVVARLRLISRLAGESVARLYG